MSTLKPRARQTSKEPATPTKRRLAPATPPLGSRGVKPDDLPSRSVTATLRSGRVPAKWRWHHRALLALQSRLLGDRGNLLHTVAEPLERHSLDEADSATDEFDHNLALSELSTRQDSLYEVEGALRRIGNGTYGVCLDSRKPIPAARLRAVPWTRFTWEVEARLEKGGLVNRPHLGTLGSVRGEVEGIREAGGTEAEKRSARPEEESLHLIPLPPRSPGRPQKATGKQRIRTH